VGLLSPRLSPRFAGREGEDSKFSASPIKETLLRDLASGSLSIDVVYTSNLTVVTKTMSLPQIQQQRETARAGGIRRFVGGQG
jgi:hypothetical protein